MGAFGLGGAVRLLGLGSMLTASGCASRVPSPPPEDVEDAQVSGQMSQGETVAGEPATFGGSPKREDPCDGQRAEFEQLAVQSRTRSCRSDSECVAICGAFGGCPDRNVVVHAEDSSRLEAIADRVRQACGNFAPDPAGGYVEIEARCVGEVCEELRTAVAPLDESL